ncbi:MAG: hypothetical protein CVT79_04445 [Alphaproteobacteria bacterium HGW-Alphaproteobacteria-18]|nr:MAG: hypothetical protein CVT79_04445 [Alphaproteobacteria bacterium HGW-Alphaproteobacteria-18]
MTKVKGYAIRPVRAADLQEVFSLSMFAGAGLTSLQPDIQFLGALIAKSEASFAGPIQTNSQTFLLVMESFDTGEIVGCASIKTCVGTDDFMCADFAIEGGNLERPDNLILKRTLEGFTEVGSLFLRADHRASGAGRFLARARYILMANQRHLFDQPIVAQLRGWSEDDGRAPFYDEVWSDRLRMTYQQSDARLAREGARFILDVFEGIEIDPRALSVPAASAIARPHPTAAGALKLLEEEGFRQADLIDLADGGPIMVGQIGTLSSLQTARPVSLKISDPTPADRSGMLSNSSFSGFRACVGAFQEAEGSVACPAFVEDFLRTADQPILFSRDPLPHLCLPRAEIY